MNDGFLYYFRCKTVNRDGNEVNLVKVGMTTDPVGRVRKYRQNKEVVGMVSPPDAFERLIAVNEVTLCEAWILSKLDDKFSEAGNEWFLYGDGSVVGTVNKLFDELEETKGLSPERLEELVQTRVDKRREYNKQWREENPEYDREKSKRYYNEHKDEIREGQKQYYNEHKDEIREYNKQWREENPDKVREQGKRYYDEHKDEIREYRKQWRKENPDKVREQNKRARERKRMKKVTAVVMTLVWACASRNG